MEVSQGEVNYFAKDDKGEPISERAAEHMSVYRIRCHSCDQNFCHGCETIPYHIGKMCDEFKELKEALKCRFCANVLKGNHNGSCC